MECDNLKPTPCANSFRLKKADDIDARAEIIDASDHEYVEVDHYEEYCYYYKSSDRRDDYSHYYSNLNNLTSGVKDNELRAHNEVLGKA